MKIVLVGYMGSGKSTIGNLLASQLGVPFLDLDDVIAEQLNTSIPEIFKEKGELFFRKKEHQILKKVLNRPEKLVLALGGGTPCYSGNMQLVLDKTSAVFYLHLPIPDLISRLRPEKEHRPLIKDIAEKDLPEFIGKHLFERRQFYSMATYAISCSGKEPQHIVQEINSYLV